MSRHRRNKSSGIPKAELYLRAQEAIEYLIECNCLTNLSKRDFAAVMAPRYGRVWLYGDGTGNDRLVSDVCNLTRDQAEDPYAAALFGGFTVTYAPNLGGMALFDPEGELSFDALIHMLSGDMQRQQSAKTINRRRIANWNAVGHQALSNGNPDLGRISFQIEREIEANGVASDSLVAEFLRLVSDLQQAGGQR